MKLPVQASPVCQNSIQQGKSKQEVWYPYNTIQDSSCHVNVKKIPIENKKILRLIDALLARISKRGDIKHFSFLVLNNPQLKKRLEKTGNKRECMELMLKLGRENGCEFTMEDVKAIPESWGTTSVKSFLLVFFALSNKGLAKFLSVIKKDPKLQNQLIRENQDNFAELLLQLGKEHGYTFNLQEVEEAMEGISYQESETDNCLNNPDTPNCNNPDNTNQIPDNITNPQVNESPINLEKILGLLRKNALVFLLASIILIPVLFLLSTNLKPRQPNLSPHPSSNSSR